MSSYRFCKNYDSQCRYCYVNQIGISDVTSATYCKKYVDKRGHKKGKAQKSNYKKKVPSWVVARAFQKCY